MMTDNGDKNRDDTGGEDTGGDDASPWLETSTRSERALRDNCP